MFKERLLPVLPENRKAFLFSLPDGSQGTRSELAALTGIGHSREVSHLEKVSAFWHVPPPLEKIAAFWRGELACCLWSPKTESKTVIVPLKPLDRAKRGEPAAGPLLVAPGKLSLHDKELLMAFRRGVFKAGDMALIRQAIRLAGTEPEGKGFWVKMPANFDDPRIFVALGVHSESSPFFTLRKNPDSRLKIFATIWSALPLGGVYLVREESKKGCREELWLMDRDAQRSFLVKIGRDQGVIP